MTKKDRGPAALKFIYKYWKSNDATYPSDDQVAKALKIKVNNWGGLRRRLIEDAKLLKAKSGGFCLNSDVIKEFRENDELYSSTLRTEPASDQISSSKSQSIPRTISVDQKPSQSENASPEAQEKGGVKRSNRRLSFIDIPIYGQVRAGTGRGPEDLVVDLSPSVDTLSVPDVDPGVETYVLEVTGDSMVSDHIMEGDYIIVEKVSFTQIKDADLVVAKYLKEIYNDSGEDEIELAVQNKDFEGPTLKYFSRVPPEKTFDYRGRIKKVTREMVRLSPKNRDPRYTISTYALDEDDIGRVIAVHRMTRRL